MILMIMMIPGSSVIGSMSIRGGILGGGGGAGGCIGFEWFWIQLMMIHDK